MKKRLEMLIAVITDEQAHKIERALLELANHADTDVVFDIELGNIIDDLLNY